MPTNLGRLLRAALFATAVTTTPSTSEGQPRRLAESACGLIAPPRSSEAARDADHPGAVVLARVPSGGVQLPARLFVAAGPGPHPTLLLLHGFPGTELNLDLAHAARRAGWNVLVPHYRGAWGAPGRYAWSHVLEDARAAVAWLRLPDTRERHRVDAGCLVAVGHSLGGFTALMLAAGDTGIRAAGSLAGFDVGAYVRQATIEQAAAAWDGATTYLAETSGRRLAEEAFAAGREWELARQAAALAERPVLLVAARRDVVAPPALHHAPLVPALGKARSRVHEAVLDADHGFVDARPQLGSLLLQWLDSLRGGTARPAPVGTVHRR